MDQRVTIKVENLSKCYQLGKIAGKSFTESISGIFSSNSKSDSNDFWALKDLNFEVREGDVLGIVGSNGAGKSTLLKLLSRITQPTTGQIEINGRVSSLLEVGTGFHPELTGRENVFLNGTILGMTRKEVKSKFDEIVDFSGVEKFLDTPIKRYSSGMKVRLAFSVAAHLEPEILIIDEVLAVGDLDFQKKCLGKMKDVAGHGRTVLFVSHNMAALKNLCTRGLLIDHGNIIYDGTIEEAVNQHIKSANDITDHYINPESNQPNSITEITILNKDSQPTNVFKTDDQIVIQYQLNLDKVDNNTELGFSLWNNRGVKIFHDKISLENVSCNKFLVTIPSDFLVPGTYSINAALHVPRKMQYHAIKEACSFDIEETGSNASQYGNSDMGVIQTNLEWQKI